jgi:branched-chain amino acid transport system permease protein
LDSPGELMMFAAVCLALASIGVAALRRGRFGRRLIALRDSEAAYATLGGNLLLAKVLVFGLSSGIAGLGGALYGMQQRSITPDQFSLVAGLPVFLVAVVGGLGVVGTGLFTGVAYVGPANALIALAPWTLNLVALLPGLAGLGLASNPDGVVPRLRSGWEALARSRTAMAALLAGLVLAWLARLGDLINGWTFFIVSVALAFALRHYAEVREARKTAPAVPEVPLEWWGIRRDWRPEDGEVLTRGVAAG